MRSLIIRLIATVALVGIGIIIGLQLQPVRFGLGALGDLKGWAERLQLQTAGEPGTADQGKIALQPQYRSGPFRIGVAILPERPKAGQNELRVVVSDAEGKPLSGIQIRAVAEMPAMGQMPAMQAPAEMKEVEPGLYRGDFDLSMEGSWPLTLSVEKPGLGQTRLTLDMATGRKGLRLSGGATPIAGETGSPASSDGDDELPYRSGPYHFDVAVQPDRPTVGKNTLTMRLQNAEGQPIRNAAIKAVAEMPAMGQMPAMHAPAEMKEVEPGLYRGDFDLSMEGSWPLSLAIRAPGMPERTVAFDMATGRKGLRPASGIDTSDGGMAEELPPGTVTMDARRRQLIGVTTAEAEVVDLTRTIRAVGQVSYDETLLADVTLKFDAWIGKLNVNYVGAKVEKGQPLFTVYSPKLLSAQQEYLELKSRTRRSSVNKTLLAAARKRLTLWDMTGTEIEALERRGVPEDYVTIHAPRSGTVIAKNVVEGTAQKAGTALMRIADLSQVWLEAEVYEAELPLVRRGMPAEVTLPYLPDQRFEGTVDYVYPYLKGESRTGRIRLTLANPDGVLKPEMYAEAEFKADLGKRLTVPEESVIISGGTRVVFEDLGGGRLAPRIVKTGQYADGRIEILEGLKLGAKVVTSGNFLIASESRLKAAIKQW